MNLEELKSGGTKVEKFTLITGGASGLGKDLAKLFAKENNNLLLISSNENNLSTAKKELSEEFKNIKIETLCLDLANPLNLPKIKEFTDSKEMFINNLVNCSGYGDRTDFKEMDIKFNMRMTELNCNTPFYLCRTYINDMIKNNEGSIMNIASIAAFMPAPFMSTYHATKAYLLLLSEAISRELKGTNVTCTAICPGPFASNFVNVAKNNYEFDKIKVIPSEVVANKAFKAYKKKKVVKIIGFKNQLMVFALRFVPRKLVRAIAASTMKENA